MKKLILFTLALILTACSLTGGTEFSSNQEKWQQSGVTSYRFSLFIGCFCPFVEVMPLTIEVRNGEVVSMAASDGSIIEPSDPSHEFLIRYATLDRIFAELDAELDGGADEVIVSYDPTYGYPAEVSIDRIKEAIDDEMSLQISAFEVLR